MFVDWFMKHQKYKRILQSRLKMNQNKCDVAFSGDIHISRMSTIGQLSSFAPNPARSLQRLKFAAISLSINTIHNGTRNKFCFFFIPTEFFLFFELNFWFSSNRKHTVEHSHCLFDHFSQSNFIFVFSFIEYHILRWLKI